MKVPHHYPDLRAARAAGREKACHHPHPEIGEAFDYCADCGATREKPKGRGGVRVAGPWHTCELCRLSTR